jgi:hypothetical protein
MQNRDTHILIHAVGGWLTQAERNVLAGYEGYSDIVLWEISDVCLKLRALDFYSDPADEIIAAESAVRNWCDFLPNAAGPDY